MIPTDNLNVWQLIALRLAVAVVMAGLGAFLAVSFKKISHRVLCVLISFAAGALLAVSLLDILPESIELVGWTGGLISALTGYLLFFVISKFVSHICPACSATHTEINFKALTITMVVALSIHSFMDGLAIYSGYLTTVQVGFLILLAVAYHKLPEGMALALVARGSGMSRKKAFLVAVLLEATTTIGGGFAGFFTLIPGAPHWTGYVLGHVGGGFVYLVIHALLSEVVKHHPRSTILAALFGAASIGVLSFLG